MWIYKKYLICQLKASYRQFGDLEDSEVVGNSSDDNSDLVFTSRFLHVTDQSGQRQWRSIDFGHEETTKHDFVELSIGTTSQKAVQFDQKTQVDVVGLGSSPSDFAVLVVPDVDSLESKLHIENFDTTFKNYLWSIVSRKNGGCRRN